MSECQFTNSNGRSLDPWCATHECSAICCMRELREVAEATCEDYPSQSHGLRIEALRAVLAKVQP